MGIFHDIPETYTRDIPSPIKDSIPNFRKITEAYELEMMRKICIRLYLKRKRST